MPRDLILALTHLFLLGGTLRRDAAQACCAEDPDSTGGGGRRGCSWLHSRGGDGGTPDELGGIPRGWELLAGEILEAPPMFRGKSNTLGREGWIKQLSKIFEAMSIPDERKLILVPFILEDEAEFWRDMIARTEDDESSDALMDLDPNTSYKVV